ncbi:MAG TPA: hypothetical protein VGB37_13950 [Candidatus Lokiarchaeia archaeon]
MNIDMESNLKKEANEFSNLVKLGNMAGEQRILNMIYNHVENYCLNIEDVKKYLVKLKGDIL